MTAPTKTVKDMAAEERGEFADFLATLTPEQWETPSLCAGWTVRDVVRHAIGYDELGWPGTLSLFARSGFSLNRSNAAMLAGAQRSPDELIALLRRHRRPRGVTGAFGGMIALVDGMIHQQDVRRPLGMPRQIPAERLRTALRLSLKARAISAAKRAEGLTVVATDVDWTHGTGPQVRGPGEALLLAMAGRAQALPELSGPGCALLAERM